MSKGRSKVIGIDLGTTNSACAVVEGGKPIIIPNAEGGRLTPSVVTVNEQNERIVGIQAKRQAVSNPEETVRSIKRYMGTDHTVRIRGKDYTPQEISSMILAKIKKDAEDFLGHEVKDAVITVPAYFHDAQRQATKDAGTIAGLNVLRIINEPTSSSLSYGIDKEEEQTVFVFDLGGGTFDVSILELAEGVFEVKATAGNNKLGGDDFDNRIVDWLVEEFRKDQGIDLSKDAVSMQRLLDAAESAKIELSTVAQSDINLPYITADASGPKHLTKKLTRALFERMTSDLIEATLGPSRQALSDAGLVPNDIDRVLLVGGSTRIPAVQNAIRKLIGKDPSKEINPDECVALGAAIQAAVLTGEVEDVLLLDVTPLSLGIETLGRVFTRLIERNTTIPTRKSQIFSTAADSQTSVEIHVQQGEREMAMDNKTLGKFHLVGIPPAPRGIPQIEVGFDIDANGILSVSAKDLGTGNEQNITVTSQERLADEDINRMINDAEKFKDQDKVRREEVDTRNEADALIYQTERSIKELGDKLDPKIVDNTKAQIEVLKKSLEGTDIHKIKNEITKLSEVAQEIGQAVYAQQAQQQGQQQGQQQAQQQAPGTATGDDDVVDVDYEIVDDE